MSDVIADMLTRIRNGQRSKLMSIVAPYSQEKEGILSVLKSEGYIASFAIKEIRKNIKEIEVDLKYSFNGKPVIYEITRISKPGRRIYRAINELIEYKSGMGVYILSTSKGIMSDRDARRLNLGGEVLCRMF